MCSTDYFIHIFLVITIYRLDLYQTAIYLKGSTHFEPCAMKTDLKNSRIVDIYCDPEASLLFGNELPIIKAELYLIRSIVIKGNVNLKRCRTQTYQDITTMQNMNFLKILIIEDSQLSEFENGCFNNLTNLEILHIRNQFRTEPNNMIQLDQQKLFFKELKKLTNLQELYLENINLSIGLPKLGFDGWCKHLKILHLTNNQLSLIHSEAFKQTNTAEPWSLNELYLEQQQDGWKLLSNSNQWASKLYGLRKLSLANTNLFNPYDNLLRLDLGNYVNHHLVSLNLQNCGLSKIIDENLTSNKKYIAGLNLIHMGEQLEELYIGQNQFEHFQSYPSQDQDDFLMGLKKFTRLRILGLDRNQLPFHTLPTWLGSRKRVFPRLEELRLAGSGLTVLNRQNLPSNIKMLDLSENPLRSIDSDWANNLDNLNVLYLNYIRLITVQIDGNQADWSKAFSNSLADTLQHLSFIGCQLKSSILKPNTKITPIQQKTENQTLTLETTISSANASQLLKKPNLGLDKLPNLKTLILTENYLTYIPDKSFEYLTQLESLVLTNNHLVSVEEYNENLDQAKQTKLSRKSRLKRLDLDYNQLTTLDRCSYALGFSKPLEDLLPQRPIWLQDETTVTNPMDLNIVARIQKKRNPWFGGLNLMHNPWVCDCRLGWLRYFVDEMSERIRNAQSNQRVPRSYLVYLNEAINFTCQGQNKWTGKRFLELEINDLYSVNHTDCTERSDVYGSDASKMTLLKPCSSLNRSFTSRLMIESSKLRPFVVTHLNDLIGDFTQTEQVSKEAGIMIVLAGAAALCFMLISIGIIVWLCIRLKRQETITKNTSKLIRGVSKESKESRTGKNAHLCLCCKSDETKISEQSNKSELDRPSRNNRAIIPKRLNVHNDQTESCYYELSDQEETITTNTAKSSLARRIRKRNREIREGINPERRRLVDGGRFKTNLSSSDQNVGRARFMSRGILENMGDTRTHPESMQSAAMGSRHTLDHEWIGQRPPQPLNPLPPLPLPRKTKSTADLLDPQSVTQNDVSTPTHYSIGTMIINPSDTTSDINKSPMVKVSVRNQKKEVNMNILASEISSQMNKVRELDKHEPIKDRKGYYIMLPWRSKSTDSDRNGEKIEVKSKPVSPKICLDCGPKCSVKSNNWFNTNRKRLENSFSWIKSKQHQNPKTETKTKIDEDNPTENLNGPELPKPHFLIPKETNTGKTLHDYLPMSAEEQQHPSLTETTTSMTTIFTGEEPMNYVDDPGPEEDEYVTDLAEASAHNRASYIRRHVQLQRKSSKSEGNPSLPVRPPRHQRLQLTNDMYGLNLLENSQISPSSPRKRVVEKPIDLELPPPPPPPPYLLHNIPQMSQDTESLTRIAIQNQVPVVSTKSSGDSLTKGTKKLVTIRPPPPLLPKPRNLSIMIRSEPGRREKLDRHSNLDQDV